MNSTGISQFNQARVEWAIRLRYSPMPKLDMELLATELNAFRIGELRTVGKTWEVMMERDGELAINSEKRKADSACLEWQISSDGSPDGDKHAAALQYFYENLTASRALDQDATGSVDELVYQVLSAVDYYYSAHEILLRVDNPAAKEITAEFRHTPIWFFEARRGYLGYLKHIFDMYGQPCIAGEWLTAVNSGLMRQLTMPYCAKWMSMRDWLLFGERYGSGFLEAITDATNDSKEWNDAQAVLNALANDGLVLHNRGVELKFLEQPSRNQLPFQPVVELVDRLYAKCYRGVDLATGSRSGEGAGGERAGGRNAVGASVQKEESGILLVRDAKWITGVFNDRIDRPILRYLFNEEPRAWFALLPPLDDTSSEDLQSLQTLVPMGLRVALKEVYKRFRWSVPGDGEQCLESPKSNGQSPMSGENPISDIRNPKEIRNPNSEPNDAELETQDAKLTHPAQTSENTPIAAGADPARNPGLVSGSTPFNGAAVDNPRFNASSLQPFNGPSRQMPDPQVDAGAFWSRVGLAPRGADGQTLPMPSLGYAMPNADPVGQSCRSAPISGRRSNAALPSPQPPGAPEQRDGGSTLASLLDRHASLVARGLGNSRAAQALHKEITRRQKAAAVQTSAFSHQPAESPLPNDDDDHYDPDEHRDKDGKWTSGPNATGSKSKPPSQPKTYAQVTFPKFSIQPPQPQQPLYPTFGDYVAAHPEVLPHLYNPSDQPGMAADIGQMFGTLGRMLSGGLADLGETITGNPTHENFSAALAGEPMPMIAESRLLPTPLRIFERGAQGLVESAPKIAAVAALQAGGVPAPLSAGLIIGTREQGFDLKQGAIAAALPVIGKYSGAITEGIASKLGISSEVALQAFNKIGGAGGAAAIMGADQWQQIANLPPDKRKDAFIDAAANACSMLLLSMIGDEKSPQTGTPENVPAKPANIPQEKSAGEVQLKSPTPEPPSPTKIPLSASERQTLEQDIQAQKPIKTPTQPDEPQPEKVGRGSSSDDGLLPSLQGNVPNAVKRLPQGYKASYSPDGSFIITNPKGVSVKYNALGFPDFSPYLYSGPEGLAEVRIKLTNDRDRDEAAANAAAGFPKTPKLYTWHHNEDTGLMQLVDKDIHREFSHLGGVSINKRKQQ